ncbi:hypothetical protein CONCODRAFT_7423 [Conidiobolus coronatus NRRL 28638]|uniref:Uncharacterized protein n=1 Tax=Conidiobolus coronatus (strain ATCC 28846 / CBS 209.66 / NRRL 28638) TaxID=796925 RepID=A0A137P4Z8_CONC2|nr:hypothetical protein CONCODRAFT_7423 [Conidiobolus coronatus NRRL 28638]|eukprot:KXN70087.1 hypothetical protein CONCODRAFT_7423 [Conidiobolus coronatus NRRL 28638]
MKLDKILNLNNPGNKASYRSSLSESLNLYKKKVNKTSIEVKLKNEDIKAKKNLSKYNETKDSYLECLKRYLNEDLYIDPTKAMERLRKEVGLEVSITLVQLTLTKLREELGPEVIDLDEFDIRNSQFSDRSKLKDIHLACLRKCIEEDRFIGPTEAWNRLRTETGIDIANSTVQKALFKLRKEMSPEQNSQESSGSEFSSKITGSYYRSKLKDSHIDRLREYLKKDSLLRPNEAMDQLRRDTGLIVSISTVYRALSNIREEIHTKHANESSSTIKTKKPVGRPRKQGPRPELRRKNLKENRYIKTAKMIKKYQDETSLEKNSKTTHRNLKRSINKMSSESARLSSSAAKRREISNLIKIKESHIQCLKKYLKQDISIGTTEAMNRLHAETGLAICPNTARTALIKSRRELDAECGSSDSSSVKSKQSRTRAKLNDSHMQCLKKYLEEDRYIMPTRARERLQEDTGLNVSVTPVRSALINLRKNIYQYYNDPSIPASESLVNRNWYFGYNLQDSHIEFLGKCLSKNHFIGPNEARKKLKQEMGLEANVRAVKTALKRIRGKMYPNRFKPYSSAPKVQHKCYKLKEDHITCLKRYLSDNSSISPAEAKKKLRQETGHESSLTLVNIALKKLRKK